MKSKDIKLAGLITVFVLVVAISGCTANNSTKHFDNGNISFDYPTEMSVKQENNSHPFNLNIHDNQWVSGVQISTIELNSRITLDKIVNGSVNDSNQRQVTQLTVGGKTAYNVTSKNQDNSFYYATIIDLGSNAVVIKPTIESSGASNPTNTNSYKAYSLIVKTVQIK